MMDPKVKRKWLKALRSGEYVQGQGALCKVGGDYDEFCCLGVLVNEMEGFSTSPYFDDKLVSDRFQWSALTWKQGKEWGITLKEQKILIDMNDGELYTRKKTFEQIADWIEENL